MGIRTPAHRSNKPLIGSLLARNNWFVGSKWKRHIVIVTSYYSDRQHKNKQKRREATKFSWWDTFNFYHLRFYVQKAWCKSRMTSTITVFFSQPKPGPRKVQFRCPFRVCWFCTVARDVTKMCIDIPIYNEIFLQENGSIDVSCRKVSYVNMSRECVYLSEMFRCPFRVCWFCTVARDVTKMCIDIPIYNEIFIQENGSIDVSCRKVSYVNMSRECVYLSEIRLNINISLRANVCPRNILPPYGRHMT